MFNNVTVHRLVNFIAPRKNQRILDMGCGEGDLICEIKTRYPAVKVMGIDVDPDSLATAQEKFKQVHIKADVFEESATETPFKPRFFDKVTATLVIHHIKKMERRKMVKEVFRILKPGGQFFLYDFRAPKSFFGKLFVRSFGFFEDVSDGVSGNYYRFLKEAGFMQVKSVLQTQLFELIRAKKPARIR